MKFYIAKPIFHVHKAYGWLSSEYYKLCTNSKRYYPIFFFFYLFIFFSQQCPPCRSFTPKLVEFYEKLKGKLEIIFISSDKDESQFKEYLDKMPWVAVPYSSGNDMRGKLNELYEVEGSVIC